jgi:hypothetical protein
MSSRTSWHASAKPRALRPGLRRSAAPSAARGEAPRLQAGEGGHLNLLIIVRRGTPMLVVGTAGGRQQGSFERDIIGPPAGDRGTWWATPAASS